MSDLVAFLRARLDEDERLARAAIDEPDGFLDAGPTVEALIYRGEGETFDLPARVLADVDAKRRMLDLHERVICDTRSAGLPIARPQCAYCAGLCHSRSGLGCDDPIDALWPCDTVRLLALPYADHPDYDESWRP